jgi:hypothetical protein
MEAAVGRCRASSWSFRQHIRIAAAAWAVVKGMRLTPFTLQAVLQMALVTLAVAALLLTMMPLEQLLERMFKILF